ncbi:MAG: tRNA(fMet)-specific endonuclease VapC (plasmid) [Candidatus Erwinia impunctatus]
MLKFMLDTNICIFTIKNKPEHVRERFNLNRGLRSIRVKNHVKRLTT